MSKDVCFSYKTHKANQLLHLGAQAKKKQPSVPTWKEKLAELEF